MGRGIGPTGMSKVVASTASRRTAGRTKPKDMLGACALGGCAIQAARPGQVDQAAAGGKEPRILTALQMVRAHGGIIRTSVDADKGFKAIIQSGAVSAH